MREFLGAITWTVLLFVLTPVIFTVLFFATLYGKRRERKCD